MLRPLSRSTSQHAQMTQLCAIAIMSEDGVVYLTYSAYAPTRGSVGDGELALAVGFGHSCVQSRLVEHGKAGGLSRLPSSFVT
jgi:hypothetical protein